MKHAAAPGKIILSGEYAVVFGYSGIAVPSSLMLTVDFEEDPSTNDLTIHWQDLDGRPEWAEYLKQIIAQCGSFGGTLTIANEIPLNKGMGSSTALMVALFRTLMDGCDYDTAQALEEKINGYSGIDFPVIWNAKPVYFTKENGVNDIDLPKDILSSALLIDLGAPAETTNELVAWVTERKEESDVDEALKMIGSCTERLAAGEEYSSILPDNYQAQLSLGIVSPEGKELITKIEQSGGAAKMLGAGARDSGGMILAINVDASIAEGYPVHRL